MSKFDYAQPHPLRIEAKVTPNFRDSNCEPGVFNVATTFVNGTPRAVSVIDRTNNVVVIPAEDPSRLSDSRGKFVINIVYTFKNAKTAQESYNRMKAARDGGVCFSNANGEFLSALEQMLDRMNNWGPLVMRIRHEVPADRFDELGAIYHENTDLALIYATATVACLHPHSAEANSRRVFQDTDINRTGTIEVIEVVDNERIATSRYYYSMKQVVTVVSRVSETQESGVYLTTRKPSRSGVMTEETRFLSFENAEKEIGLYLTQEDARTNGDPQKELALRRTEAETSLENAKAEHRLQQQAWESEKSALDREKVERDHELEVLRHELEQSKLLARQRADERTEVLSAKKENLSHTSDVLRTVAAAIGAIVTLAAAGVGLVRWLSSAAAVARVGASIASTALGWLGLSWFI